MVGTARNKERYKKHDYAFTKQNKTKSENYPRVVLALYNCYWILFS